MCYFSAPWYTNFKISLKNQSYYCNLYFAPATPPFLAISRNFSPFLAISRNFSQYLAISRNISLFLLLHRSIFDGLSTFYRILLVSIIYMVYYPVKPKIWINFVWLFGFTRHRSSPFITRAPKRSVSVLSDLLFLRLTLKTALSLSSVRIRWTSHWRFSLCRLHRRLRV